MRLVLMLRMKTAMGRGSSTTLAKKIETATQAKHRRVHAREITRLRHMRAVVSICLARVVLEDLDEGHVDLRKSVFTFHSPFPLFTDSNLSLQRFTDSRATLHARA